MVFTAEYKSGKPQALEDTAAVNWFDFKEIKKEMLTPFTYEIIKSVFRE